MNNPDLLLKALSEAEADLARLTKEREHAVGKVKKLRAELASSKTPPHNGAENHTPTSFSKNALPEEKIRLFADLFRGRDDVFAKLWISKTSEKKGYSPVCEYEWQPGICTKPLAKCTNCKYLPLSHEVIRGHLEGRHTIGVYPLRLDETCYFLAVDFDKKSWQEDAAAFLEVCRAMNIPAALERSRSGNGAHVWIFFSEPVSASLARNLGSCLITETMSRHHQLGMESYDRFFPNQDTMPKGGFGNLIALPLQKHARQHGNTEFLDEQFQPYADQWAYLASIKKLNTVEVQRLVSEAAKRDGITGIAFSSSEEEIPPWAHQRVANRSLLGLRGHVPSRLRVTIANQLYIEKSGLPSPLLTAIKRLASFHNPKFYEAQSRRLSTFRIPRIISCAENFPDYLAIPRGCLKALRELVEPIGISIECTDERIDGETIDVAFHGKLTESQEVAVQELLRHDLGMFVAPPGSGKTVVGINLIARRKRSTLVLVYRQPLMEQWRAQLMEFLNVDSDAVGQIGGGKNSRTGTIDVAMLQSLVHKGQVDPRVGEYGHIIVDECHHVPAFSFEQVLKQARARYVTGLTATPYRRDGHHPIIYMQCGPVQYQIHPNSPAAGQAFTRRVIVCETDFVFPVNDETSFQEILGAIATNESRNQLIFDDVMQVLEEKRSPIILTERREHVEALRAKLEKFVKHLIVLHGGKNAKDRKTMQKTLAEIPESEERVILATGSYVREGFDDSRLDTLFLAMPISFKGKVQQYTGRILRTHPGKSEVRIYDYVDGNVPMLARMFKRRLKTYRAMGYLDWTTQMEHKPLIEKKSV